MRQKFMPKFVESDQLLDYRQICLGGGGVKRGFLGKIQLVHKFEDIVGVENLLAAWGEFVKGKRNKKDVQEFSLRLMENIFVLHHELAEQTYVHGGYKAFKVFDPKPRDIHKAPVRDRMLHHAIYRILYPFFERTFIADSYSCRLGKGTHRTVSKLRDYACKVSKNNTCAYWVLKCDVRKFFASIDHAILLNILREYIPDEKIIWLLEQVISSFSPGIPLGNLTSQLFANVYLNKLDQFIKHQLKAKYYLRYADDFVIISENKKWLEEKIEPIGRFLREELKLKLHSDKIFIRNLLQGIDFLGYVILSHHTMLRTKTKKRIFRKIIKKKLELRKGKITEEAFRQSLQSYLGVLSHAESFKLTQELLMKADIEPISRIEACPTTLGISHGNGKRL
jgi:RNA-directed DNA polymerase